MRVLLSGVVELTSSRVAPSASNSVAMNASTPRPKLTSEMTAPTPMMIPSVVSTERKRLMSRLSTAMRNTVAAVERFLWLTCLGCLSVRNATSEIIVLIRSCLLDCFEGGFVNP